jgi:hypothetical protein
MPSGTDDQYEQARNGSSAAVDLRGRRLPDFLPASGTVVHLEPRAGVLELRGGIVCGADFHLDVATKNAAVRKAVIAHTVISFLFNASILGFAINVTAGLIGGS